MTVNISLSDGSRDGALRSSDSGSPANALAGSVFIGGSGGTSGGWGWWYVDGIWNAYQTFLYFSYTPPTTERITSAALRVYCTEAHTTSLDRELGAWEYDFGAAVTAADWRNTAWFAANGTLLKVSRAQNAVAGQSIEGGSDSLITRLASASPLPLVLTSLRVSSATYPTGDEFAAIALGGASGTATDPALVWTTIPVSTHEHVAGAQVRLSTGDWAYLESNGAATPAITLKRRTAAGATATIDTVAVGTSSSDYLMLGGLQTLALVVDASDNLYIIGPRGDGLGALIMIKPYLKGSGSTWTALTAATYSTPAYDRAGVHAVAATWHAAGTSGTIMCVTARGHGDWPQYPSSDLAYALLNCNYLLTGSGTLVRNSGSGVGTLVDLATASSRYARPTAETGTGIDVQAPSPAGLRGIFFSWSGNAAPGELRVSSPCRYTLAADGTSLTAALSTVYRSYFHKEANGKARVLAITDTLFVVVTMDSDSGWGPSFNVIQNVGSASFSCLAYVVLDGRITSLPAAATLAASAAWDVAYDPTDNKVWLYYIDRNNARRIVRTALDMNTYLPTLTEVEVTAALGTGAASVCRSLRVERNARTGDDSILVSAAVSTSGVLTTSYYVDSFNLAPNAPALVAKSSFDAAASASFSWVFSDPNAADAQSAFELDISTSAGTSAYTTGKVSSANESYTLPASSIANSGSYRWRVRVYDGDDEVSPWSTFGTFETSASGTVTITAPATDNPAGVITDDYTVTWSVAGTTQVAYRVVVTRVDTSATLVDTGWVTSTATSYTVTGMLPDVQYRIAVTVRNGAAVESGTGTRLILSSYSRPETPLITVTPVPDSGYTLVAVENPESGAPALGTSVDDFEAGVSGYAATNCTFTQTSAYSAAGTYSARLTATSASVTASAHPDTAHLIAVEPGGRYTVSYQAYAAASASNVYDGIWWYDAASAALSSTSAASALAASAWSPRAMTASAPTSAAYAAPGIALVSPSAGQSVYVDNLILTIASDRPVPTGNAVHRRRSDGTGPTVVIADETTLGVDGTVRDYTAAAGVTYEYRVQAVASTGSSDSEWAEATLPLQGVWIHDPLDPDGTVRQYLYGRSARSEAISVPTQEMQFAGRSYPVVEIGESQDDTWTARVTVAHGPTWAADVAALREFVTSRRTLYVRDNRGRAAYSVLTGYRGDDRDEGTEVSFSVRRVDWIEATV